jgi:putative transposase
MRGRQGMKKKGFTAEQIITMLREAEVLLSQGSTAVEAARKLGITEQTYYRWRKEYGGMQVDQAKRFKELEKENTRLKKLVADLSLDNAILKEVSRGNCLSPFEEETGGRHGLHDASRISTTGMQGPGAVPVNTSVSPPDL